MQISRRNAWGALSPVLAVAAALTFVATVSSGAAAAEDNFVNVGFAPAKKAGTPLCRSKYPAKGGLEAAFLHPPQKTCYACPAGFKRSANPRIKGEKACITRKPQKFAKAVALGRPGCGKGSFRHGLQDQCYTCPAGYKRGLAPGKDLSEIAKACVSVKVNTRATPAGELVAWAKKNIPAIMNRYGPALKTAANFGKEINKKKNKKAFRKLMRSRTAPKHNQIPASSLFKSTAFAAKGKGLKTITTAMVFDGSALIAGLTFSPFMVAQGLGPTAVTPGAVVLNMALGDVAYYQTGAWTVGPSLGLDFTIEIGLWVDEHKKLAGNSWGFTWGGTAGVGGSWTVWLSYKKDSTEVDKKVRFLGATLTLGTGLAIELEHARGTTALVTWDEIKKVL